MFAIIISEKGGGERRETFDRSEITVGRVQGNDLMLPKGNVSKRHCRLEMMDGRFVVTDQNSTNGTYVNRRRITQSTVVRQGDRIYIGDFILRLDTEGAEDRVPARDSRDAPSQEPESIPDSEVPSAGRSEPPSAHDSGPPAGPLGAQTARRTTDQLEAAPSAPRSEPPAPALASAPRASAPFSRLSDHPGSGHVSADSQDAAHSIGGANEHLVAAIRFLVERVSSKIEARLLDRDLDDNLRRRVARTVDEVFATLPAESVRTSGTPSEEIKEAARAELLDLGPLSRLIDDPAVSEVTVSGAGYLNVVRAGNYHEGALPFCSARSVERALARLCKQEGLPIGENETVVKRQFVALGFDLEALRGEVARSGALIRLKRRDRVSTSFEDLVRAGVVSRSMATFLRHCVNARASLLVVGGRRSGAIEVLAALAQAAENERILFLQDESEIATSRGSVLTLGTEQADQLSEILIAAVGFSGHRLVVDAMQGERAIATLRAISEGAEGTIARIRGGTIERTCARVCAELGLGVSGMTSTAVADALIASFDVAIEVARLRDGRSRVLRICELHRGADGHISAESVFDFVVERTATGGSIEGTFRATGRSPQLADEIRARGNRMDSALFVRPPSSG